MSAGRRALHAQPGTVARLPGERAAVVRWLNGGWRGTVYDLRSGLLDLDADGRPMIWRRQSLSNLMAVMRDAVEGRTR